MAKKYLVSNTVYFFFSTECSLTYVKTVQKLKIVFQEVSL